MRRKYRQYSYDEFAGNEQMQSQSQSQSFSPVSTPNTIGGAWEENRGRRSARPLDEDTENPFENGKVKNWNHRTGWDEHYVQRSFRPGKHGGSLIGPDHTGKGPKGYTRSDDKIYEEVCETLAMSPDIDASQIEVEVKSGKVHLTGKVENREMKRMSEFEIEHILGVVDVKNDLEFSHK